MHYAVQPRPLTQGALRAMQRSLLVLAVVLAHADAVQAMLPPTNRTSTTPPPTTSSTTPQMRSKTTPPPSTPRPIPPAQSCTAYTDASCPIGDRVKRGKDLMWGSQQGPDDYGTIAGGGAQGTRSCKVEWDNGLSNSYRVGRDGAYDLCLVSSSLKTPGRDPANTEAVSTAWFHGPALSSRILLIFLGVSGFVLVAGLVAMRCFRHRKRKITLGMKIVLFVLFFLFDFVWMIARFAWLLNSEDAQFQTMKTPKKGEYIWIGPKFERSSWSQRHQLGCNFSLSELQEAPDDACKVWWVSFSADISFQGGSWDAGAAKFSVGFGLVIFVILEIGVFLFVLGADLMMEEEGNLHLPTGRLSTCTRSLSVC